MAYEAAKFEPLAKKFDWLSCVPLAARLDAVGRPRDCAPAASE